MSWCYIILYKPKRTNCVGNVDSEPSGDVNFKYLPFKITYAIYVSIRSLSLRGLGSDATGSLRGFVMCSCYCACFFAINIESSYHLPSKTSWKIKKELNFQTLSLSVPALHSSLVTMDLIKNLNREVGTLGSSCVLWGVCHGRLIALSMS